MWYAALSVGATDNHTQAEYKGQVIGFVLGSEITKKKPTGQEKYDGFVSWLLMV